MKKLISWNVNSVRARLPLIERLIQDLSPDVLMLQELKCTEEQFPHDIFEDLGYNLVMHGQKTFNGVAILSKIPFDEQPKKNLPSFDDPQARFIETSILGYTFMNVYVPNGQDPSSDKYIYKLEFFDHLYEHLKTYVKKGMPFVLAGDFNVALNEEDTAIPDNTMICFTPKERQKLNQLLGLGLIDLQHYKNITGYTWWDYRGLGFPKNIGMRLDYVFLSPDFIKGHETFKIQKEFRKLEKTSDHAPLMLEF